MNFDKAKVAAACKQYGGFIQRLPATIDGALLLWALSGNESSFGQNTNPRHEVEYCPQNQPHRTTSGIVVRPGRYAADGLQVALFRQWGCWACCSYTPWQLMAVNAIGYTPIELMTDLERSVEAAVSFASKIMAHESMPEEATLDDIARFWNGSGVSQQYIDDLKKYYAAGF